jgi:hypothetical protein
MIDGLIIELFLAQPATERIKFLNNIRELCDLLELSDDTNPDNINNLFTGENDAQSE